MKVAAVVLLALLPTACLDSRERLEPPRVYLKLDETSVAAGGEMSGRVSAADRSGIIYIRAQWLVEGDPAGAKSASASVFEQDTVDFDFGFTVKTGFPSGTRIFIDASARDDQNFEVTASDTVTIR